MFVSAWSAFETETAAVEIIDPQFRLNERLDLASRWQDTIAHLSLRTTPDTAILSQEQPPRGS
jgi:hypothetical protein